MPQLNRTSRTSPGSNAVGKAPGSKTTAGDQKGRRTAFIIAAVVIVLILIIVRVSLYIDAAPFRRTIITVDDISIKMDYFLMRTRLAGVDSNEMIDALTNEQLIKIEAPQYVTEVSPEDIDQTLREVARGESETISESEFKEWYRQLLNEVGLSDSEYEEIVAISLLTSRFHEYLAERVATVAEQVHIYATVLKTYEDAEEVRARWVDGEDFTDLAREVSLDEVSGEQGGDFGWLPRGILPPGFDRVVFNLAIDDVSEPLAYASDLASAEIEVFFYLLMVSEKADAREIEEGSLQILQAKILDDWLLEEIKFHEVEWNFTSEIYWWITWQLAKE